MDEVVVKLRKERKKKKKRIKLSELVITDGESYLFEKMSFYGNTFSIMLPSKFYIMDETISKVKYPSEQGSDIILTNNGNNINFTFHMAQESLERIKQSIQAAFPANVFYEEGIIDTPHIKIPYFDFKSFSQGEPIYNLMYGFLIKQKIIIGSFNCAFEFFEDWKAIMIEVLHSIEVNKTM